MPFAYPNPHALRAELLDRVAAGETVMSVCTAPHMPTYFTVRLWARADDAFAEALRVARLRGAWRRRYMFDEARAEAVLVRVRAGGKLHEVLGAPDMPSRRVFAYWRASQPHIAEELHRLHQERWASATAATIAASAASIPLSPTASWSGSVEGRAWSGRLRRTRCSPAAPS